jgi:O-antigen/teichoic acid export membrane protein
MFRIPPEYHDAARWTVILVGLTLVTTLTCGMYGAVLVGLNRFDLLSGITITQVIFYALGTVWLLRAGHGLIALSSWQAFTLISSNIAQVWYGRRLYPQLRLRWERPDLALLREIWTFSFYLLLISVSGYLIYFTGNVITGAFISTAAVTMFSIAVRLVEYHRQITTSLAQVFMPLTSSLHAQNDSHNIHRLLIHGTRVSLLVALPIQGVLFLRGSTFIGLWVGPEYGAISGYLLQILMLSNFFLAANGVSSNITFGLGKHKPYALWQSAEAVANVALTLWLVKGLGLGLAGVAWGVTLPNLVTQALVWPVYITRLLKFPLQRYLLEAWLQPALAVLPFALGCAWADRYWPAARLDVFFLQICAMLPLYAVGLAAVFHQDILRQWRTPDSLLRRRILQPLLGKAGF